MTDTSVYRSVAVAAVNAHPVARNILQRDQLIASLSRKLEQAARDNIDYRSLHQRLMDYNKQDLERER